ncbi:1,4-butanediol diacrylate esterase [Polymorphobacter glacialis]|uniref:1,4-butanediol diacrylate esterase n=1 Tax=Sandarakinorhabdus glacialis TaxID=1614636 RepID=A0A917E6C2_9SPHN|nr:serine hydrolase domain-containing protein [Polymorphobacter glacialis]GGE09073.1 1,4-butanediol diacrylate esterase [Polymorphobacter glacialis]
MSLDRALAEALDAAGIPGAVAMVADRDGLIWQGAFGLQDPATAAPMTTDTLFQLASMSKAVTSVAALQLVESGILALDAPVGDFLPGLAEPQVITGFDDAGRVLLRPATRPITLRHLLTHTSGLGYDFVQASQQRARGDLPPIPGSLASLHTPLQFDPGDGWGYGVSTDWIGLLVEAASGQRLDDYFADHIFAPLGMTQTGFELPTEGLAAMHAHTPDGGMVAYPISIGGGRNAEFLSGGGGLSGSGGDYLRFLRMLLNGGSLEGAVILQPETVAEMFRNQIGALRAGGMTTTMPALSHAVSWFPDMTPGWSLGFMINPEAHGDGRSAGSLSWAGIANTYYWIDPAKGIAALLLMQFLPFADPGALAILSAFERAVYAS